MSSPAAPALVFTHESTSTGYTILCNGVKLGGAGTAGTPTHTRDGRRRSWQAVRADIAMHAATARRVCAELAAGRGGSFLRSRIPATV